jgi:protein gp37
MADSKIEWTEKTWNPIAGCTPRQPRLHALLRGHDGAQA